MDEHLALLFFSLMLYRLRCNRRSMAMRRRRRRLFLFLQRGLLSQTLPTATSTNLALLNVAYMYLQSMPTERPWTLRRPRFGWFELMLEDESQSRYWKEHFRMRKETFLRLVNLVSPEISRRNTRLRDAIPPAKRVAIALWRLAGGASFREVATHFDVGKSSCVTITKEFCRALNRFSRRFIKLPVNHRDTTRAIALFQDECKIPQAVGAIDGTHIEIVAPKNPFDYFDRQHRYSVIMQAAAGENLMFLDTAIGYPGSMHDARVLRNSELFRKVENGNILREPVVNINGNDIRPLLLGDGAYPLLPWLLKPYPNNIVLNPTQRRFNKVLSSARVTVERAFGVLKGRWRILLKRMGNRFINVPEVILTCCILHNFCQEAGEEFDDQEILRRVIGIEREYLQSRRLHHAVRNPAAQAVRQAIENDL